MGKPANDDGPIHREAFALMWYGCRKCPHRERVWNSRDGVTPFGGARCPSCGAHGLDGGLTHVYFELDEPVPNHKLRPGQRFWRDGTADEGCSIIERRIELWAKAGQPIPENVKAKLRHEAVTQTGAWKPGWPWLDEKPLKEID